MSLFQVTKKQVTENYELRTITGDIVSFTPSYSQLLPDPFSDLNVTVDITATGGNGTPDNPNPINGYSEANIANTQNDSIVELFSIDSNFRGTVDFNQFAKIPTANASKTENGVTITDNRDGTYSVKTAVGGATADVYLTIPTVDIVQDHKYLIKGTPTGGGTSSYYGYVNGVSSSNDTGNGAVGVGLTTQTRTPVPIFIKNGTVINTEIIFKPNIIDLTQLFGSTIADYIYSLEQNTTGAGVAFFRSIYPADYYDYDSGTTEIVGKETPEAAIAFGQTVYSGVLDVTRGKLHVTWGASKISDISWNYDDTSLAYAFFWSAKITNKALNKNALCSCFLNSRKNRTQLNDNEFGFFNDGSDVDRFVIRCDSITSIPALTSTLGNEYFAYELATPFDIDLTPEVISAIVGTNNVFADCGETTVTCLI